MSEAAFRETYKGKHMVSKKKMNNDLREQVVRKINYHIQSQTKGLNETADELITLILDEVKELAENEKVGANENDGEGDRYYDKALTDLIRAIDNLRGRE